MSRALNCPNCYADIADVPMTAKRCPSCRRTFGPPTEFHCGNQCPYDSTTKLCRQRHWCEGCGDCEFCYGEGPHEWD